MKRKNNYTAYWIAYGIIAIVILSGCRGHREPMVIKGKSFIDYFSHPMPKGLCRYAYTEWSGIDEIQEFTDSCSKYNIGDTIVGRKIIN